MTTTTTKSVNNSSSVSQIAACLSESVTLQLNEKAGVLVREGKPVIHLGGGQPKSKAPIDTIEISERIIESREVRYTPASGTLAIKKEVVDYTKQHYGREVDVKNVIVSNGAKQCIYVAMQAILDPGDEMLMPTPYWVSYPEMVRMLGAVPVAVPPVSGSFIPEISEFEKLITPRTRAVIINSPNNPSGMMYPESFIRDIVAFCEQHHLYLIMDDIYHRLQFGGQTPISCFDYSSGHIDQSQIICINGVSKQYAMTGYRIGWAVAARSLIKVMGKIQGHQTSGPCTISQAAAVAALQSDQSTVAMLRETLERNRDLLVKSLGEIEGVKVTKPNATFYCFADFSAIDTDATRLANILIDRAQVITVPGKEFGMEGHLRISFCGSEKDITEGVARIKWAVDPNAASEITIGDHTFVRNW